MLSCLPNQPKDGDSGKKHGRRRGRKIDGEALKNAQPKKTVDGGPARILHREATTHGAPVHFPSGNHIEQSSCTGCDGYQWL